MKKLLIITLLAGISLAGNAQNPSMASLFREIPDSLMPYLSKNNRLDMLDFRDAQMKAEVTNLFDGKSEMTALTDDSLSIRMSEVLQVSMKLEEVQEPVDSAFYVIRLWRDYQINENQTVRIADVYSSVWRKLSSHEEQSTLLRRDEGIFERLYF